MHSVPQLGHFITTTWGGESFGGAVCKVISPSLNSWWHFGQQQMPSSFFSHSSTACLPCVIELLRQSLGTQVSIVLEHLQGLVTCDARGLDAIKAKLK